MEVLDGVEDAWSITSLSSFRTIYYRAAKKLSINSPEGLAI